MQPVDRQQLLELEQRYNFELQQHQRQIAGLSRQLQEKNQQHVATETECEMLHSRNRELTEALAHKTLKLRRHRSSPSATRDHSLLSSSFTTSPRLFTSPSWSRPSQSSKPPQSAPRSGAAAASLGSPVTARNQVHVVWVDNLDRLKKSSRVVDLLDRLGSRSIRVQFVPSTDACISQVTAGGVRVVVTNIGRTRPDSGLILVSQLIKSGFEGKIFIYSRSANADSELTQACIDRGATAVLLTSSPDSVEQAIVAATLGH